MEQRALGALGILAAAAALITLPTVAEAESSFAVKVSPFEPRNESEKKWAPNICADFPDDAMRLSILRANKEILSDVYCSSYNEGTAKLAQDALGKSYILKEYGEGRGTDATTEYLVVYAIEPTLEQVPADRFENVKPAKNGKLISKPRPPARKVRVPEITLIELARTEIFVPRWQEGDLKYIYHVDTPEGGGLKIELTAKVVPMGDQSNPNVCCVAKDATKVLQVDTK
jgi:hypothetical protein